MCFSQIRRTLLTAAVAVCACTLALGQATASLTFEVASVKPSAPGWERGGVYFGPPRGGPGTPDPVQITWTYARFRDLLMTAYGLKTYQITGPAWLDAERYDIVAKVPPGATKQQVNVMWQNLLAERFGLKVHHEPIPPGAPAPSPDAPTAGASDPGPDFAAAVQQQLGLRLVAGRANLDVLVIDKAERVPSEN